MIGDSTQVKGTDEAFCFSCGAVVKQLAEICVHCGVRLRPAPMAYGRGVKSKAAAILLAVFLGFWTWLYTYREDSAKFWVSAGANLLLFIMTIATLGVGAVLWFLAGTGIWIWSIVDTVSKPDDWYADY